MSDRKLNIARIEFSGEEISRLPDTYKGMFLACLFAWEDIGHAAKIMMASFNGEPNVSPAFEMWIAQRTYCMRQLISKCYEFDESIRKYSRSGGAKSKDLKKFLADWDASFSEYRGSDAHKSAMLIRNNLAFHYSVNQHKAIANKIKPDERLHMFLNEKHGGNFSSIGYDHSWHVIFRGDNAVFDDLLKWSVGIVSLQMQFAQEFILFCHNKYFDGKSTHPFELQVSGEFVFGVREAILPLFLENLPEN